MTSILDKLRKSDKIRQAKHDEANEEKSGYLRAGNTGCEIEGGDIVAECPRLAHLRRLGLRSEEIGEDRICMFEGGYAHQDLLAEKLREAGVEVFEEGQEGEITTDWLCGDVHVTGSVDIGLGDGQGNLTHVVDAKAVCSLWTARDILVVEMPKIKHLAQLGHYMMETEKPGKLAYGSYVDYAVNDWAWKLLPLRGDRHSECIEYRDTLDKVAVPEPQVDRVKAAGYRVTKDVYKSGKFKGKTKYEASIHIPKKILPFRQIYDVRWGESGYLEYSVEGRGEWTQTILTEVGIREFYCRVLDIEAEGDLGKRPLTLKPEGTPENYNRCDYCGLKSLCDEHENNYQKWLDMVKQLPVNSET